MIDKLKQIRKRMEQFEAIIKDQNFFGIEEIDLDKIKEIKDPVELEKLTELFLEIRNLSTHLKGPFNHVQFEAVQLRIEIENHLELLKQKALQEEELIFYFKFNFLFLSRNFY